MEKRVFVKLTKEAEMAWNFKVSDIVFLKELSTKPVATNSSD